MKPQLKKEEIAKLILGMAHYDPDLMETNALKVAQAVVAGQINLDGADGPEILEAFMKQMQSENKNVNAHAIKCIADIVPKLPVVQVELLFKRILTFVTSPDVETKKRERYGCCAGTVIHKSAENYGEKLLSLFLESVKKLLQFKDQKNQIQNILIIIIYEFIQKWPAVIACIEEGTYDKKSLAVYLLKNIENKSKLSMVKKSQQCLGKLATVLDRNTFATMFQDQSNGLFKFLRANFCADNLQKMRHLRNGLFCLFQILRSLNTEIRYWAVQIVELLLPIVKVFKDTKERDHIDEVCDILETCLTCLNYSLKSYSKELKVYFKTPVNSLNEFIKELINFNIQEMMCYATPEEPMDVQKQENQEYYQEHVEEEEKSCKVRKATLQYLATLVKYDNHLKNNYSEDHSFVKIFGMKLIEENSMVTKAAFQAFFAVIEFITVERNNHNDDDDIELVLHRVKSSEYDLGFSIIQQISSKMHVIFNSSKFNEEAKSECSRLLLRIIQIEKIQLCKPHSQRLARQLIRDIEKQIAKKCDSNLMNCLKELIFVQFQFKQYESTLKIFLQPNHSVRVQPICFQSIRKIIKRFPTELAKTHYFQNVVDAVAKKLKENDCDKELKMRVLQCVGPLFQYYYPYLQVNDLTDILQCLSNKLKIDLEKTPILEQISKIPDGVTVNPNLQKQYEKILQQISDSLDSTNFDLNTNAVAATYRIVLHLGNKINPNAAELILQRSKGLFLEGKIPLFVSNFLDNFPTLFKPYAELIVKSIESSFIVKLIQNNILTKSACISILRQVVKPEKCQKISVILGKIGMTEKELNSQVNESLWGKTCLGAIGYVGNVPTALGLLNFIQDSNTSDQLRFVAASAIGNIASRFQKELIHEITMKADITADCFMHFIMLREMFNLTERPFGDLTGLIEWIFRKAIEKYDNESSYYVISECVGKMAFTSSVAARKIFDYRQSSNDRQRMVLAGSLRFGLENKLECPHLSEYVEHTIQLANDSSLLVKEGATKSLSAVSVPILKEKIPENFWGVLCRNMRIDEKQIIEINYGISKEKKDLGKGLRLESFNLLELVLKKITINYLDDLVSVALEQIDQETSSDILLKRLNVIKNIFEIEGSQILRLQSVLVSKLGIKTGFLKNEKALQQSKKIEDERLEIYLKTILNDILEIQVLARKEGVQVISWLLNEYKSNAVLAGLLEQLNTARR